MFYADPAMGLAVAQIPKAGLVSLQKALGKSFPTKPNNDPELLAIPRRVAFVRHPVERLRSAYSFFCRLKAEGIQHSSGANISSWESFVDQVLAGKHDDEHWRPQVEHIGTVPNIIHRLEDIDRHWHKYSDNPITRENTSPRQPTNDYRINDLRVKYAADMHLWLRAA